jgi:hypothetical protein
MRVIVNFIQNGGFAIHCMAEDCRTRVSGWTNVADKATLMRALRYVGATEDEITLAEADLRRWSHGNAHITLLSERKNILKIKPEYASPLGLW